MRITLALVGDLMFSHRVREVLAASGDPGFPLRPVVPLLRSCDLRIANLETPVSLERKPVPGARPDYFAPPAAANAIEAAGFDLVTLANNHIHDFGPEGVEATIQALERVGVRWCGVLGPHPRAGVEARLQCPEGGCLAVLAYCGMRNVAVSRHRYRTLEPDVRRVCNDVRRARDAGCVVVVSIHEGSGALPLPDVERTARKALFAGASVVVVHHAHVLGGFERVGSGVIAWGLGNFLAATNNFSDERREGAILRCTLGPGGLVDFDWVPTWISDEIQVVPAPPAVAARVRARVAELTRIMVRGEARVRYEDSVTASLVVRRLAEAVREMLRGGGRNIWPTLRALRLRHARFVWLGVRSWFRRVAGRGRSRRGWVGPSGRGEG